MADLKKENFSLKLKIYYLETTLSKVSGVEQFDVLTEVCTRFLFLIFKNLPGFLVFSSDMHCI